MVSSVSTVFSKFLIIQVHLVLFNVILCAILVIETFFYKCNKWFATWNATLCSAKNEANLISTSFTATLCSGFVFLKDSSIFLEFFITLTFSTCFFFQPHVSVSHFFQNLTTPKNTTSQFTSNLNI